MTDKLQFVFMEIERFDKRAEEQRAIAKRLLAAGVSIELVAEGTGLTVEQVRELQKR